MGDFERARERERERERERSSVKAERDLKEDIGNPFWKIRVLSRHDAREISSREEELFVVELS